MMNISIAKKRISQVLAVDSINSSQADFLATHVPFRKITLESNVNSNSLKENLSEDDIYSKLFNQENNDNHQFIIVEGSSGVGKSHFIRWINAKLDSDDNGADVVLLIRRSDNTLKGTIRQLLEIDEVKNIGNKDAYERLVKANQTISEKKFKATIYNSFIVEIQSDEKEGGLSNVEKKNLIALLQNDAFQSRMMKENGPVERIYNKVSGSGISGSENDTAAQFTIQDFLFDIDFLDKLKSDGADKRAIKMAEKLLVDDDDVSYVKKIIDYIDSFIDRVIQSCSGIQSGDFEMIFKEIRQELRKQGKSLILLIEDITSFTGLNQELLGALFTSHTGENSHDNLCRLISIVGTTTEYYRDYFRDNYRDRITSRITINDGAIGENKSDLIQFFARYLNAMSVESEELEEWKNNGALSTDMPVHSDQEANIWGVYNLNGQKLSLFPFTENAIVNLVEAMDNKLTPRYIIRTIIEPAVNEVINAPSTFPSFCKKWRSQFEANIKNEDIINRINNIVQNMGMSDSYAEKIRKIIGFWGNSSIEYKNNRLAGLPSAIYMKLQLGDFFEKVTGVSVSAAGSTPTDVTASAPDILEAVIENDDSGKPEPEKIDPELKKRQEKYLEFRDMVNIWHNNPDKKLTRIQDIRDAVCGFVFETLNWQQFGIPNVLMKTVKESQYSLIAFARQDQKLDRSYIVLDDNDETYHLLLCFGKYVFIGKKSWDFDDSESEIYTATLWLEKHKKEIIETVRGAVDGNLPLYIKNAIVLDVLSKTLNGTINANKISDIKRDAILKKDNVLNKSLKENSGHCKEWIDVLNLCYPSGNVAIHEDILLKYFNIIMGATDDAKKMIVNQSLYTNTMKSVKDLEFIVPVNQEYGIDDKIKSRRELIEQCSKISDKSAKAAEAEVEKGKMLLEEILSYFGYDLEEDLLPDKSDINKLLSDIREFYEDAYKSGCNINSKKDSAVILSKKADEIEKAVAVLAADFDGKSTIEKLLIFSNDPIGKLQTFIKLLEDAERDVDTVADFIRLEKEKLIKKGTWEDNKDPRFVDEQNEFNNLYAKVKEVK